MKKRLAHRLGGLLKCRDCYDFVPHIHPERLSRIPSDPRIFVNAHTDMFGRWWMSEDIERVLEACRSVDKETWFFESKNPWRFLKYVGLFPEQTMLSATIETNRVYHRRVRGHTLTPLSRCFAMMKVKRETSFPVHVSIEPILDFDLPVLVGWMRRLDPSKVAVGYDSLNNGLPEPPKEKTVRLIDALEKFTEVEQKEGID